jgi:hypothetical protein
MLTRARPKQASGGFFVQPAAISRQPSAISKGKPNLLIPYRNVRKNRGLMCAVSGTWILADS